MGAAIRTPYHSHYVLTRKHGYPITSIPGEGDKFYDEIVIEQEPCILPVYLLLIKAACLSLPLLEHCKEYERLMDEEKDRDVEKSRSRSDVTKSKGRGGRGKDKTTLKGITEEGSSNEDPNYQLMEEEGKKEV